MRRVALLVTVAAAAGCGAALRPRPAAMPELETAPAPATAETDDAGAEPLVFPVPGAPACSRGFAPGERHFALDIPAPPGTPVRASAAGVVVRASRHRDYGLMVVLRHAAFTYTLYAHLATLAVEQDQRVEPGQAIGEVGSTGNARGSHLHFELLRAAGALPLRAEGPLGLPAEAHRVDPAAAMETPAGCGQLVRVAPADR